MRFSMRSQQQHPAQSRPPAHTTFRQSLPDS